MKNALLFYLLGSGLLLVGGCATTWPTDPRYIEVVDQQKIDLIELGARTNNTKVIWVTAPTRKIPMSGS